MNTFLEHVATDLLNKYGTDMAHITVVFPNKRAALFLNQALARLADGPVWSPVYITISDFFRQHSELTIADPIKSICDLYKSYIEVTGNTNETLDHFYGWGQLLLADFDDIDKNMANAHVVFSNINNLKELDDITYLTDDQKKELRRFFANFDDNPEGIRERFMALWAKLNDIYSNFKQRLRAQGLAYEGMLYREVVENQQIEIDSNHYVFVGFNVLQKVEQQLFKRFLKEERASFYWDYDYYYMQSTNEAGNYIRSWLDKFPNALPNDNNELYDNLGKEKNISIISAPTENMQARYITEWLKEDNRYKDGKRTAIVLCDEHLLQTVIHCIPNEVESLNVTTGYPLQQTLIASMVSQLLTLQIEGYSIQEQSFRLHYVNRVLRHPYGKYLIPEVAEIIEKLNKERQYYVKPEEGLPLSYYSSDRQNLPALVNWLSETIRFIGMNGADDKDPLFEESVFRMYTLLTRLSELMANGDLEADKVIFRRLLTQLIASTSIPFHGEPAQGVQVMGVLETRNLDFDHVLVLSCNEGNMPKGIDDASFIPHLIRKAYNLTTIDNKVSIYSYYFHSMIQRAKDVTFLYNNSTQGSHTGEMSRFILQLMVEWNHPIHRLTLQAGQDPMRVEAKIVEKNEAVLKKLDEMSYFSPTAINTYITCKLKYYFKYIAGIKEADEIDVDDVDNRIFGNIFHTAAQLMYEKLLPREIITAKDIDKLLKTGKSTQSLTSGNADLTLDDIVDESFAQELFNQQPGTRKHPKLNGLQLINREVIIKYLHQLLRIDRRTAPLRVIGHEFPVKRPLTIKVNGLEKQIETGGRIDRLDEIYVDSDNARLRVVDYKTGSKVAESLKSVDEMFDSKYLEKKSDYTMQAMLYSLIEATNDMEHNPNHHAVSPALLFIQHAGSEDYTPVLSIDTEEITDVTVYEEDFLRKLTDILEEIHNPDIAFEPTSNPKNCEYCPYKQMCGR